jgi:hypothetical protein
MISALTILQPVKSWPNASPPALWKPTQSIWPGSSTSIRSLSVLAAGSVYVEGGVVLG